MPRPSIRTNNFDLIRLLAASQVVVHHAINYLQLFNTSRLVDGVVFATLLLPGVPIFFFVSGFLISKSYESSATLWQYARNRALRIYPALIVCTIVSVAGVFALGYLPRPMVSPVTFTAWIVAQMTFVQFFNPDFMRGFGVGVLNSSLWTIAVELQFYVLVPLVYWVCGDSKNRRSLLTLCGLVGMSLIANALLWHLDPDNNRTIAVKLFNVSFLPWFYMFLLGVLAQRYFVELHALLAGRGLIVAATYLAVAACARQFAGWPTSNDVHPVLFVILAAAVFSAAFTWPTLSERLLRHNDVSYGVYVYHMPCINAFLYLGWSGNLIAVPLIFALSFVLAALSWRLVEQPCLALKKGGLGHNVPTHAPMDAVAPSHGSGFA